MITDKIRTIFSKEFKMTELFSFIYLASLDMVLI